MSDRKGPRPTLVELAVVAGICGVLSCCLWPVVRDARGPAGDPIPNEPPDEANRVYRPLGLSIVVPPDWAVAPAGLLVMAPQNPGRYARRSKAMIVVTPLGRGRPTGLENLRRTEFLGQEAYEGMRVVRAWSFDDGAWSEYTLDTRQGEDWYEIRYGIEEERTSLPEVIRRYLGTLRWEEGRPG